jgi:mono/diheme cytochrome c family protein
MTPGQRSSMQFAFAIMMLTATVITARGAPPPLALTRRLRGSLEPQALITARGEQASARDPSARGVREHDPAWVAPESAALKSNPLAGRPDAEPGGRKIFQQRCVACHADDGRGTPKGPDLTQPDVQSESDGALFWKITSGNTRQGMPTFSSLPEAQRWQLVLRIRSAAEGSRAP